MSDERETRIGTTRLRLVTGDIALRKVVGFLRRAPHVLEEVRFVLYVREDATALAVFSDALEAELSRVAHPSGTASNG